MKHNIPRNRNSSDMKIKHFITFYIKGYPRKTQGITLESSFNI